jgi:LysM repeat protein
MSALTAIQNWLGGPQKIGVYIGIESANGWRAIDFVNHLKQQYGESQPDTVYIKCWEYGREWYDGTFSEIRDALRTELGIGAVPYGFDRPITWKQDAEIAIRLGNCAGGVILDDEEPWIGYDDLHVAFVRAVKQGIGNNLCIVSGYGDPATAVPNWSFRAVKEADGYQAQWYLGYWPQWLLAYGATGTIDVCDNQIASQFGAAQIPLSMPILPALVLSNMQESDQNAVLEYIKRWQVAPVLWELESVDAGLLQRSKAILGGSDSQPPTPVQPATYTVQRGDNLSLIAGRYGMTWQELYDLNRAVVGPNPNLIKAGEVLTL